MKATELIVQCLENEEVARMETNDQSLIVQWFHPGGAALEQIDKEVRIISEARQPIVLAGNGVIRGRASPKS